MFASNVAPKRRVRQKPGEWLCKCAAFDFPSNIIRDSGPLPQDEHGTPFGKILRVQPGYLKQCPDCKAERP